MARRAPAAAAIRRDALRAAEAAAGEVVLRVHPTREAERRRQDVIAYLRRLIGSCLGCEVFAFGSVPLRTYLPDGDVDITVLGNTWLNSTFIDDVRSMLQSEQENCDAEFKLTGLQFINAEVKLIKCVIENIIVDVSFNQIGGVSTFCFLELVDRQIGQNHLFKRSIMLIKAWCYHESRILGAHHGLISTYALETLVLYIFNMFHKSLHGPLEALYRFLEYFSKFDWDRYGISLNGQVDLSSLTVEPTDVQGESLLGKELQQGYLDRLVVIPNEFDGCGTQFRQKFLNIIDPLKANNNLGRSVSKANFYRIRSAFSFGAQKLGQILLLPSEYIRDEIYGFFANTLKRHGNGERPDVDTCSSFHPSRGPESALTEDGSKFKFCCMNEGENGSSCQCHSSKLPDKDSSVTDAHKNSGKYLPGLVQDISWNKIWFMEYASDFKEHTSTLASLSSHSPCSQDNSNGSSDECFENYAAEEDLHQNVPQQIYPEHPSHILTNSTSANILDFSSSCFGDESDWTAPRAGKKLLPPFLLSNMLDLSGDLELHLGCLRKVQYHLESLFDELLQAVEEACLADVLDEDSFKMSDIILKLKTSTRSSSLSLVSSTDSERRKLSHVYCSHSTGDDLQLSHAEVQVDMVWQQNVPLSPNGSTFTPSPSNNSDNYHVSWFCFSPTSHGTGTYIPNMSYHTYRERMMLERETIRARKQRQRFPDRRYYSAEQGFADSQTEDSVAQSGTNQSPTKQNSAQQSGYSSKSSISDGDFVRFKEHVATNGGTKQAVGRDFVEKGRHTTPPSSPPMTVLLQNGQGKPTCQPSSPVTADLFNAAKSLEFGSLGPFSLGLPSTSTQFEEEFPALPTRKRAEGPISVAPSAKAVETKSRSEESEEMFRLRNESDFPPLQAGCR
uniref:PAP/OAS1 substrate-binding-related domain-containing protein n=3 Tax=Zea mays TaxID=4577 RepID=A0A804QHB9_MAIZE